MRNLFLALLAGLFLYSPVAFAEAPAVVTEAPAAVEAPASSETAPSVDASEVTEVVEDISEVTEEVSDEVGLLAEAVESGAWPVAFGLFLTILVAVVRKFALGDKLPAKAVPWVSIVLAVLGSVGAGLSTGMAVGEAVLAGLAAGLAAIGGWEAVFKHVKALQAPSKSEG